MRKKKSIQGKILAMVLCISILSVLVLSTMALFQLSSIGVYSAEDSSAALTQAGMDQLLLNATSKAEMSEEKLARLQTDAMILQNVAGDIYRHPERYTGRPAKQPDAANAGTVVVHQFFDATYEETPEALEELALLANIQDFLEQFGRNNPAIAAGSIYLATESGIIFMADVESDKHVGDFRYDHVHTRPWYERAKETGEVGWTDVMTDESGRGLGIVCSAPVYDNNGDLKAVVGVGAMLIDLEEIVNADFGETGYSYILNEKGSVILSKQTGELGISPLRETGEGAVQDRLTDSENTALREIAGSMLAGESGVITTVVDGQEVFAAYAPIPTLNWSFGAIISTEEVLSPATELSQRISETLRVSILLLILISAAILLVVVVVSRITAGRLSRPILQLSEEVSRIGNGSFDYALDIRTEDEIQILSESFRQMTEELKDYIANLQTITAEKERIGAELNVATQIQKDMLPNIFPAFPDRRDFNIYATMDPAKEVGGDFYDFFMVDDTHLAVVMADVSGKGVPAALFMVIAKTIIKNQALAGDAVEQVFMHANDQLCENNGEGLFVTAFMGLLDLESGEFVYANAGHNAPLLRRGDGAYEYLDMDPGFVLAGLDGMVYSSSRLTMGPGDTLFLYTDGVTEALNPEEELYGEERLRDALNAEAGRGLEVQALLPYIRNELEVFARDAEQADDITMLGLTYNGAGEQGRKKSLTVPAQCGRLEEVQGFVDEMLEGLPCDPAAVLTLQIAVEELFVNIASYAYAPGEGDAVIDCAVEPEDCRITIRFSDRGVPFNPLAKEDADVTLSAEERGIGGLGIFMVKDTMDDISYAYEDGRNILTIQKKLS